MNMGTPRIGAGNLRFALPVSGAVRECTILEVGNPQCAFFVDDFDFDWKALGAEAERHPHFPNRTNVSFVKVLDRHTIDVRFFERGAGFTMSSGTGSTGAFFAAVARGLIDTTATVQTLAGPLVFRIEGESVLMQGPAEIVVTGEYYFDAKLGGSPEPRGRSSARHTHLTQSRAALQSRVGAPAPATPISFRRKKN
jgi:diaminopimelate epimerase